MQERRGNEQRCCILATGLTEEFFTFKEAAAPTAGEIRAFPTAWRIP